MSRRQLLLHGAIVGGYLGAILAVTLTEAYWFWGLMS